MTNKGVSVSHGRALLWSLAFMGAISAYCNDALLPIIPLLETEFSVNAKQGQLLFTIGLLGLAISQIPIGFLSDRYGRRPVGITAGLALITATLMAILAPSFSILMISRFLMGAAMGYGPILARAIVRDITATENSLVGGLSLLTISLAAATILAPYITNFISPIFGWQSAFINCLVVVSLVWIMFLRLMPETLSVKNAQSGWGTRFKASLRLFLSNRNAIAGTIFFTIYFTGYFAVLTNLASILVDEFGRSPHYFANIFFYIAVANTLGAVLCRRLSKTMSDKRLILYAVLLAISVAVMSIYLLYLGSHAPLFLFVAVITLYCLGLGLVVPAATSLALQSMESIAGFASSFMGTIQIGISTCGSAVAVAIYTGTKASLLGLLIGCALLLSLSFFIYQRLEQKDDLKAQIKEG